MKKTLHILGFGFVFLILSSLFSGCASLDNAKKYNDLSDQHNAKDQAAFASLQSAVDSYNNLKFDEAKKTADQAQSQFLESQKLSEQGADLAKQLPQKSWLPDFKDKTAQAEAIKAQVSKLIAGAADAQIANNKDAAKALTDKITDQENQFQALKNQIDQIRSDHKDFFK